MKKIYRLIIIAGFCMAFNACKKSHDAVRAIKPVVRLPDQIRADRTLYSDTVYTFYSVFVTDNAVLTIEPGTLIKSQDFAAGESRSGPFVIDQGAKIMAEGTVDKPIVFTSGSPAGQRQHGDWTGLYILGKAPVSGYDEATGGPATMISIRGVSMPNGGGGSDPEDNSGILKYVRIEFAGDPGNDSYALGCVGVGRGTVIENIEASYTQISGFGFFGGTVNARNLVAFNNRLAGFVYANGYTGKQQFIVSYKHPYFAATSGLWYTCDAVLSFNDIQNNPLIESTRPVISNLTVIGPYNNPGYNEFLPWNAAVNISYGSAMVLRNSILMGMPKGGIKFTDDAAALHLLDGTTEFSYNLAHSNNPGEAYTTDINAVYSVDSTIVNDYALSHDNARYETPALLGLTDPFNFTLPVMTPLSNSPALTGANFDGPDFSGYFQPVVYRGAFGSVNWMNGWTSFYPVTATY